MAIPQAKVEIGFDIVGTNAPLFTLDNTTKGRLDNTTYRLGGTIFYDVTDKVRSIATRRGKNRETDTFDAGLANVVFDNNDRTFDPTYEASPYYGQIIPKRAIHITSGAQRVFTGVIDDWNLDYNPGGDSTASAAASDAFTLFNTQTLPAGTPVVEYTGERINRVLDLADVDWPTADREIETGRTEVDATPYAEDANVLEYLRSIARSEPSDVFIGANGHVVFKDRSPQSGNNGIVLADDGTGIPYQSMRVVYGSELLYNELVFGTESIGTAYATDPASIAEYGVLNLTRTGLFINQPADLINITNYLTSRYSQPEYRFDSLEIVVDELQLDQQAEILSLEIGDFVTIKFTPNGVSPAIVKVAQIIRLDHNITATAHVTSIGFATADNYFWTLSDSIFGRLSAGNVLGF